jgi:hypothetical protein
MVRHRVGQRQADEPPERQRLLETRVRQPIPLLQQHALQQHQRPVGRSADRRGIDVAELTLERRPVDQRRDLLQLPVAPGALNQPVRQAQLTQLPPHALPPATTDPTAASNHEPAVMQSSHDVERQNLTMHMAMRRFTRLINAFSKKLATTKRPWHCTSCTTISCASTSPSGYPAMADGTDRLWSIEDVAALLD